MVSGDFTTQALGGTSYVTPCLTATTACHPGTFARAGGGWDDGGDDGADDGGDDGNVGGPTTGDRCFWWPPEATTAVTTPLTTRTTPTITTATTTPVDLR